MLRTGAPWRDLPERYGLYTTAHNRFNRWRKPDIWDRLMDAVTKAHDGQVQMIDSSIVRVHQHTSGIKRRAEIVAWTQSQRPYDQDPGARIDGHGRAIQILITSGLGKITPGAPKSAPFKEMHL